MKMNKLKQYDELTVAMDSAGVPHTAGLSILERHNLAIKAEVRKKRKLQQETKAMRNALRNIYEELKVPAGNQRMMQIARPARTCMNLAKPFILERRDES